PIFSLRIAHDEIGEAVAVEVDVSGRRPIRRVRNTLPRNHGVSMSAVSQERGTRGSIACEQIWTQVSGKPAGREELDIFVIRKKRLLDGLECRISMLTKHTDEDFCTSIVALIHRSRGSPAGGRPTKG